MDVASTYTHIRVNDNDTAPVVRIEESIAGNRDLFIRIPLHAPAGGDIVISGSIPAVMTWLTRMVNEVGSTIQGDAVAVMRQAEVQLEVVR